MKQPYVDIGIYVPIEGLPYVYTEISNNGAISLNIGVIINTAIQISAPGYIEHEKQFMVLKPDDTNNATTERGIYLIIDKLGSIAYIGSSVNIKRRLSGHKMIEKDDGFIIIIPCPFLDNMRLNMVEKGLICLLNPGRNDKRYIRGKKRR